MGSRSWSAVVLSMVVLIALTLGKTSLPGRTDSTPPPAAEGSQVRAACIAGRAACSGRACHGGLTPVADGGAQQNEFTTWLAHDRHARAFEVLKEERAQRMARNLGIASADKDPRCLACHSTPQLAGAVSEQQAALRSDGVSCEACHGPANGTDPWLYAHTTVSWKKRETDKAREDLYRQHGMTPLFDLEVQTKTCAGCHIGAAADPEHNIPARDLNHDLMAAGHPRLLFELGTFRANMPPHWRADLHAATPGYEAAVWAIGQAGSARASVDLLADRATRAAAGKAPWPEFAEASCFACHADLHSPSWRRNTDYYLGRKPGAIPMNRWYFALLPSLASIAREQVSPADKAFHALAAEMNKPYPDPAKVEKLAKETSSHLGGVLAAIKPLPFDEGQRKALAEGLAKEVSAFKPPDWDELTQSALAVAALREASGRERPADGQQPLDDIFRALAFPASIESPQGFNPGAKSEGQAEDVQALLLKAIQALVH